MTRQTFNTLDVLKLEVEEDPTPGELVNLIQNPDGTLGGWGWITPLPNTRIQRAAFGGSSLDFRNTAAQAAYFLSEPLPCAPARYVAGRLDFVSRSANDVTIRARFVFLNSAGAVISSGAQTAAHSFGVLQVPAVQAPAGTAYVQLRIDAYANGGNLRATDYVALNGVVVATAAQIGQLGTYTTRKNLQRYGTSFEASTFYWTGYGADSATVNNVGAVGTSSRRYTATSQGVSNGYFGASGASTDKAADPIVPGQPYAVQAQVRALGASLQAVLIVRFYTAANVLAEGGKFETALTTFDTISWTKLSGVFVAPAGAVYMSASIEVRSRAGGAPFVAGDGFYLDANMIEQSNVVGTFFNGDTAGATWAGTREQSTSTLQTVVSSSLDFIPPVTWLSVLATAHGVKVDRAPLDVGTLNVSLKDAQLDPAKSDTIRPGKRCRLLVKDPTSGAWTEPLFTATIRGAKVNYDLRESDANKRAAIELTATDNATPLSATPRDEGVATIAELPHVLEGAGVPWSVNGSGNQVANAVVVTHNDSATALDQVGITRDSSLGKAWIDRRNVLQVWDDAQLTTTLAATLTEADYTDVSIDYDTDRCINTVKVIFLRGNPATGETEEVTYGPYVDAESVEAWGPHSATFTIQWQNEDAAQIAAFADAILTANGTPAVRVNSVTIPIDGAGDLGNVAGSKRALIDLLDLVKVVNTDAGLSESLRVERVTHTITAKRWTLELGFVPDGNVASPTTAPSPGTGGNGKTLGELLRPIGEVTMFYGTKAQVPAGWLVLDGSSFSSTEYPELYALLGNTTLLPDFNDRVPYGASTAKPLGSAGGAALKSIAHTHGVTMPDHVHYAGTYGTGAPSGTTTKGAGTAEAAGPNHTHAVNGQSGVVVSNPSYNTGGASVTSVDVTQPYRALHFIIRAA